MSKNSKRRRDKKKAQKQRIKSKAKSQKKYNDTNKKTCSIEPHILQKIMEHQRQKAEYARRYGELKEPIIANFKDYKIVVVGNKVHHDKEWRTFPDFLFDYLIKKLTPEWGNSELQKPEKDKHQIISLYQKLCLWQEKQPKDSDGIYKAYSTGTVASYYQLAYDIYALEHHMKLQKEVIARLKLKNNYQGARYELTVAATFIRAGFTIEYEDETDNSIKHPEFIATHKKTGIVVSVEAKSRHRPGIQGHLGEPKVVVKANIKRILHNALSKPTNYPYLIFIDLNMQPIRGNIFKSDVFTEILKTLEKKEDSPEYQDGFPATACIFTNYPHHYADDEELDPEKSWLTITTKNPKFPFPNIDIIHSINTALKQYGYIPNEFPQDT
ncbi:hypothetical protein [Spartinivicinus poritis]|uniref:Uncharacterized protein n=1 Tax=Spartinivicinus poritis TaxID=2994640 RepID=A0ABT5UJT3_9GAMM|nr:hypothetical protein [Spartinivicinus sp. A2-2]MDE1465777.1 hypothetical protein [Spartinivicinus sp. A2-2]